jgi:uncharacterized protein
MKVEESAHPSAANSAMSKVETSRAPKRGTIWIDLDNSPHVPLFAPIIGELERRNYSVVVTARDCFQVRELADLFRLNYRLIGRHSGKNTLRKVAGLCFRALRLIPIVLRQRPDLALAVCSRSQLVVSTLLGIPSLFMGDYEFSTGWALIRPTWLLCPEVIPNEAIRLDPDRIMKYQGIKEDIYVPRFVPDPSIRSQLGLEEQDVVATIRPPASEAHYHNPQSDELFMATVQFLARFPKVKLVALPRNEKQALELRNRWSDLFFRRRMLIPNQVVDGLNLIWHSDLVISAGGTMNREAAALGVPVYSVFRGRIGAVDQYLARCGRLVLIESVEDIQRKIVAARRERPQNPGELADTILNRVVDEITALLETKHPLSSYQDSGLNQLASAVAKPGTEFRSSEPTK